MFSLLLVVSGIHWRKKWQPTPVCLLGKSHGQRGLAGCSPWGGSQTRVSGRQSLLYEGGVSANRVISLLSYRRTHFRSLLSVS